MKTIISKRVAWFATLIIVLLLMMIRIPTSAAPLLQLTEFPTPTAGPDGRILYIVQEGDTLWRIAAVSKLTLDELRQLNNLGPDAVINPGDTLLLGFGLTPDEESDETSESAVPTADPSALTPQPTTGPGTGTVCIFLYEDANGDSLRQEEEPAIPDAAISIANRIGTISIQETTIPGPIDPAEDPPRICFEELLEGDYSVTVAIPDGYNPTTDLSASFELFPGDLTYVDFGAQKNSDTIAEEAAQIPEEGGRAPTLGILGGLLLLIGIGLAAYSVISGRQ